MLADLLPGCYLKRMSTRAQAILDEIRALPAQEQREVSEFIVQHFVSVLPPSSPRRSIKDIAGKYRAKPDLDAKDHDRGFAAAAAD